MKRPNTCTNLIRAIKAIAAGTDEVRLSRTLANVIVGQMLPDGVVKGGSSLMFRYGAAFTRYTRDVDTARVMEHEESLPSELAAAFEQLQFPCPRPLRVMKLSYQVAQKLHAVSEPGSERAHDLIDLQLIMLHSSPDLADVRSKCVRLFDYRRKQPWPPKVAKGEGWDGIYELALGTIADKDALCPTVDEAVAWVNNLVARIDAENVG